jgi:hypothetical protein
VPVPDRGDAGRRRAGTGPGRLLVAVYAVFAIAATGRASLQIIEYFDRARLAYILSALAALIYIVATVALARGDRTSVRVATWSCSIELVGVLAVGVASYVDRAAFPDQTVWSHFGSGYGYVPLVLPVVGLLWLRRIRRRMAEAPRDTPSASASPGH